MKVRWEISSATNCDGAGWKPGKCRSKVRARTCWPRGRGMIVRRSFSPRTGIRCRHSLHRPKMTAAFTGADRATRRGLLRHKFWRRRSCAGQAFSPGCCFWLARRATRSGARRPTHQPIGARFMINGEPTENKLALASKGALHVELVARGKMAHSAYPELGESAIDKLVEALHRLHASKLPEDCEVGR